MVQNFVKNFLQKVYYLKTDIDSLKLEREYHRITLGSLNKMNLQKCLDEITAPIPLIYSLPIIFYDSNCDTSESKVKHLLRQLEKAKNRGQNSRALYCAYLIGRLIEEEINLSSRRDCKRLLTSHYRIVTKRLCCLFDQDRLPLILTCQEISLGNLARMKQQEYKELLAAGDSASLERIMQDLPTETLDGTRDIERENVTPDII